MIITYYWPPSGGAGVQRILYFAKYLQEYGWEPIIYTVENGEFPVIDETLLKEIPKGIEIIKTPIWEPYQLYKKFTGQKKEQRLKATVITEKHNRPVAHKISTWIRGNFFIPDARKFWIHPSIKYLKDYLATNPVDLIFSSSPPQSVHLIALQLKKQLNIPWVADFRDPWTKISYYEDLMLTRWADRKHKRLEKEVMQQADIMLTVSDSCKSDFQTIEDRDIQVITNGYEDSIPLPDKQPNEKYFTLSYTGTLTRDRNPEIIWKGLRELIDQYPTMKDKVKLRFIGHVDQSIFDSLDQLNLTDNYEKIGYVPHTKVFDYLMTSDVLLLIGIPHDKGVLTGKLFEYLYTRKPILCIGPKGGDIEKLLVQCQAGHCVDFDELKFFQKVFMELFQQTKAKKLASPRTTNISNFSRKNLTKKLAAVLDQLV